MRVARLLSLRRRPIARLTACAILTILAGAACKPGTKKLDEVVFYEGPRFQLKAVRYYENMPLHYTGEVFRIACSSANTTDSPAHKTQDAGWVTIGNGGAIGTKNVADVLTQVRKDYTVVNDTTLVWTGVGFNVSFDSCGSFRSWYATMLPIEEIDTVPKPEYCAPVGTGDCRGHDFFGERAPRFTDICVDADGVVAFTAVSPAFRNGGKRRIRSVDGGAHWKVEPLP